MYNFYGVYAACRDAAWRCQLDFDVCRLPVKVLAIARRAGIRVVKNSLVGELRGSEQGVSIFDGKGWSIIYDDNLPVPETRLVIAHELGHIFLGHEYRYAALRFTCGQHKLSCEREADMFAIRLLIPAFALHELHITDAAGIARLCTVPADAASERSRRMEQLEVRAKFYSSKLEVKLMEKFSPWLDEMRGCQTEAPRLRF